MRRYLHFLLIGLLLGLFTEVQLKLVAGINPPAFHIALAAYPVILSLVYALSRLIDRWVATGWNGDLLHYALAGFGGLAVEWTLLGNGPGSNALQFGMFAMWTTFGFGPRILTRTASPVVRRGRRGVWFAFAVVGLLLTAWVFWSSDPGAKVVLAVFGLSASYTLWSLWLLWLAWRDRRAEPLPA